MPFVELAIGTTSVREREKDVVSKPSASRGKPEASAEAPEVKEELIVNRKGHSMY
jgi:hypothetical protein